MIESGLSTNFIARVSILISKKLGFRLQNKAHDIEERIS
jgi:hypothetical protein